MDLDVFNSRGDHTPSVAVVQVSSKRIRPGRCLTTPRYLFIGYNLANGRKLFAFKAEHFCLFRVCSSIPFVIIWRENMHKNSIFGNI
jgi:hypothetical protein